jgi:hypothetical protein
MGFKVVLGIVVVSLVVGIIVYYGGEEEEIKTPDTPAQPLPVPAQPPAAPPGGQPPPQANIIVSTLVGGGVIYNEDQTFMKVRTAENALNPSNGPFVNQVENLIKNNISSGTAFTGNNLGINPRLKSTDTIYFTVWNDGGYRIYVNPTFAVNASTLGDAGSTFTTTYKYTN